MPAEDSSDHVSISKRTLRRAGIGIALAVAVGLGYGISQATSPTHPSRAAASERAASTSTTSTTAVATSTSTTTPAVGTTTTVPASTTTVGTTTTTTEPPTTTTTAPLPVLSVSGWSGRYPMEIAYGNGGNAVFISSWTEWGPTEAVGIGRQADNNCKPDCANGQVTFTPVTVTLSDVVNGSYSLITETASGGPAGKPYPTRYLVGAQ